MKKIMAALLMIVVALALGVSPALAAAKKVTVVDEKVVKKLPPVKQRPLEIGSIHEAYLSDHCLIGTMLLKGENRQAVLVQPPFAPGAFQITVRPQHYRWREVDGELEVEFAALGPALKYLCPGEREDGLYLSEFCRVNGTLQGRAVKGFC